ncbi:MULTISPECIES: hypothetical protein [Rhizobium]|nr:hypothetical protein [Rhizobium leguminosarum]
MYDINQPIFTYAGAMLPAKPTKTAAKHRAILLAICVGLLLAALAI